MFVLKFVACQANQEAAACFMTSNFQAEMLSRVSRIRTAGTVCSVKRYPPAALRRWKNYLQKTAESHSLDRADHNFLNYKSATNGTTLQERLHNDSCKLQVAGENMGARSLTVIFSTKKLWQMVIKSIFKLMPVF